MVDLHLHSSSSLAVLIRIRLNNVEAFYGQLNSVLTPKQVWRLHVSMQIRQTSLLKDSPMPFSDSDNNEDFIAEVGAS